MSKAKTWSLIIILVILAGTSFYWFQWRPVHIRQQCAKEALEKALADNHTNGDDKIHYDESFYNQINRACLNLKGLRP